MQPTNLDPQTMQTLASQIVANLSTVFEQGIRAGVDQLELLEQLRDVLVERLGYDRRGAANVARAVNVMTCDRLGGQVSDEYRAGLHAALLRMAAK